ncbi:comF family protein [compost metagenome]
MGRAARLRNLRGAFAAHPSHTHRLVGRHVLLVDDVTTTGATLQTAAQAVLHAGADRVSALVFARTPASR